MVLIQKFLNLKNNDFDNLKIKHPKFKNKNGLIMFGTNWCPHCQHLKPVIKALGKMDKSFVVGAVDCDKQKIISDKLNVQGYPTLFIVKKNGSLKEYKGGRNLSNLVLHMCKALKNKNKICK